MTAAVEVNFDGLVGPTHNYAGLSYGNLAATANALAVADPRGGALEGLAKMRKLMALGLPQAVLPPHERPHIPTLRRLGFTGSDAAIVARAAKTAPELLRNVSSASAMWTANAATITPSADSTDGRLHVTPANLVAMFHRSIEPEVTGRVLQAIFPEGERFAHHPPLPGAPHMGDEGAANHNRLCADHGAAGVHLYIYGTEAFARAGGPARYPARQTREASEAIARQHGARRAVFAQQAAQAIDAGAFHNDVVAVANRDVLFFHQQAFADSAALKRDLRAAAPDFDPRFVEVPADRVGLADAVSSYLFNSQLVSPPGREGPGHDGMTLILPMEVAETPATKDYVDDLLASGGPITEAVYLDVRQSMRNGGGPACLRLRVVLSEAERAAMGARVLLDEARLVALEDWVRRHYRDRLTADDLGDPALLRDCRAALDALTQLLDLGSIYDFQRAGA